MVQAILTLDRRVQIWRWNPLQPDNRARSPSVDTYSTNRSSVSNFSNSTSAALSKVLSDCDSSMVSVLESTLASSGSGLNDSEAVIAAGALYPPSIVVFTKIDGLFTYLHLDCKVVPGKNVGTMAN